MTRDCSPLSTQKKGVRALKIQWINFVKVAYKGKKTACQVAKKPLL
jgi:hypothetical protein